MKEDDNKDVIRALKFNPKTGQLEDAGPLTPELLADSFFNHHTLSLFIQR